MGAIRRTWTYCKGDFAAMALTIALVLAVGVEAGIVAGVILSLLLFLWRTSRPHMAVLGQVPGTEHYRNVDRHEVVVSESVLSVRVDESLYFANARYLEDRIYALVAERPALEHVVLVCPAVNFIDASALESLEMIADRLRAIPGQRQARQSSSSSPSPDNATKPSTAARTTPSTTPSRSLPCAQTRLRWTGCGTT